MYQKEHKKLTFGIDLDNTITEDPDLFEMFIKLIRDFGHKVVIVTARYNGDYCSYLEYFEKLVDEVYFTGHFAKEDVVDVDIWVDDFPLGITHSSENGDYKIGNKAKKWIKG